MSINENSRYDLGSWGCDGDFGDCTDLALRAFQKDAKLDVDGECGPATLVALEKAVDALDVAGCSGDSCPINVTIVGGNCYIRTAPNTDGKILGVAHRGTPCLMAGKSLTGAGFWYRTRTRTPGCPESTEK